MSWPGCQTRTWPLPKFRRDFHSTMKVGPDRLTWVGTTRYLGVGDSGRDPLHDCQVFLLRRYMNWRMAENLGLGPCFGWDGRQLTKVCQLRGSQDLQPPQGEPGASPVAPELSHQGTPFKLPLSSADPAWAKNQGLGDMIGKNP